MKNRTVLIILAALAVLAGFIAFLERDSMTTTERRERDDRLLRDFRRDDVSRLSLQRASGAEVVLERTEAEPGQEGKWRIVAPVAREADDSEVRAILSALDFLLIGRTVAPSEAKDHSRFGLDEPRLTASFELRGKRSVLRIGAEAQGDKVYLSLDGEAGVVHAVSKDIFEALDKGVDELRSRRLVAERLGEAESLSIAGPAGELSLVRESAAEAWKLTTPDGPVLVSANAIGELLTHLDGLRAESFVADDVPADKLAAHGLAAPVASVTLGLPQGKSAKVLVGPPCEEETGRVRATVVGSGTVACVDDHLLRLLSRPATALEERRAMVVRAEDVRKVTLRARAATLALERGDGSWSAPAHKDVGIETADVQGLLEMLGASSSSPVTLGKAAVDALGPSVLAVELEVEEGEEPVVLEIFAEAEGRVPVRRRGEPAVLYLPQELAQRARADVLAFRERHIPLADKEQITSIVTEGAVKQTVLEQDGRWRLTAPIEAEADAAAARELGARLAQLEVLRYIAAAPSPAFGLATPYAVLRGEFKAEAQDKDTAAARKTVTLRLGALVPGTTQERFAAYEGSEVVFVVGRPYLEAAQRSLLARDVLQVDETAVRRLTLKAGEVVRAFTLEGSTWTASDHSAIDQDRLRRLLTDLGTVKTVRTVACGQGAPPIGPLQATVELFTADLDKPLKTLLVGGKSDDASEDGHLARVDGLNATVVMPSRIAGELLSLLTP